MTLTLSGRVHVASSIPLVCLPVDADGLLDGLAPLGKARSTSRGMAAIRNLFGLPLKPKGLALQLRGNHAPVGRAGLFLRPVEVSVDDCSPTAVAARGKASLSRGNLDENAVSTLIVARQASRRRAAQARSAVQIARILERL
jgi:hypothetical protein